MNKKVLFALWGGFFVLCALFGFIPQPEGVLKGLMVVLAVGFFVPGILLLVQAAREGDRPTLKLIRSLSAASLTATVVLLIANFLTVMASQILGEILYAVLVIVSSPMICGQYWVLSLFLWACLMIAAATELRKK